MYKFKWKDPANYKESVPYSLNLNRRDHRDPTADEAIRNVMREQRRRDRDRQQSRQIAEGQKK